MEADSSPRRLNSREETRDVVIALIEGARGHLDILSPVLDPAIFDQADVATAIRELVGRAGARARVRILVEDAAAVARNGHQLLALGHRLSTAIDFRRLAAEDRGGSDSLVIADRDGLLRWDAGIGLHGVDRRQDRVAAVAQGLEFDRRWERATDDPDLRRLAL